MRKYLIALASIAFLLSSVLTTAALAQTDGSVDKVILASTENYPDALVASAPASKLGIPVLLTNKEEIPEETLSSLEQYAPEEVILVGGPAVISDQVEVGLEEKGYQVTRLWGTSRYGTANKVAEHFWSEGSDQALVVQNNFESGSKMLAQAKELARQQGIPLFLVPEDKIPAEVLAQMNELGVKQVTAVGPNADGIEEAVGQLGMTMKDKFAGSQEEIMSKVRERARSEMSSQSELVVVAAANFGHTISAPNLPNASSFIVSSEEAIEDAITAIQDRNITEVKVVGKPDLASQIADRLQNETDANIQLVSGRRANMAEQAVSIAHNLTARERVRHRFQEQAEKKIGRWQQKVEDNMDRIKEKTNRTLAKAKMMAANLTGEVKNKIDRANSSCQEGDWKECRKLAEKAMSQVRKREWNQIKNNAEQIRKRIRQETEDLKEKVGEMKEMNREFGQRMRQNMSVKERLEVVNTFKNQHREQVGKIMEQAMEIGEQGLKKGLNAAERAMRGLNRGKRRQKQGNGWTRRGK